MANALYDKARQKFLSSGTSVGTTISTAIDWANDNIKVVLVKTSAGYTVDLANDEFLSSIVAGNRVATSANLASKTVTAGVANAANVTFTAVSGAVVGALVIYKDTGGADTTCPLIAYIDTATGLPITPNGGDIIVQWDTGANKIFKL